ncbi:MAG: hypothetical protein WAL55_15575, partial [Candidatus Acidiferrales bacterium]
DCSGRRAQNCRTRAGREARQAVEESQEAGQTLKISGAKLVMHSVASAIQRRAPSVIAKSGASV